MKEDLQEPEVDVCPTPKSSPKNGKQTAKRKSRQKSSGKRAARPFPASSFEEALQLAKAAFDYGSGKPVRRLSLFDHLGKSPESGPSRQWITNANKYGLIEGGYQADQLE